YRWLAGRTPHPRYRARVAKAVGREQQALWPELTAAPAEQEPELLGEIQAAWTSASQAGAPDWRLLLAGAVDQIDLLDYSLSDLLAETGTIETLAAKAGSRCLVRVLIAAPDSIWVSAAAHELDQ